MKGNEKNENSLITLLNKYVKNYNEENKNSKGFIELNYWKIDEKAGYPIIEY